MGEPVLRHDRLLMERVTDRLGGTKTVAISIATLLFLVHVLTQTRLFFG